MTVRYVTGWVGRWEGDDQRLSCDVHETEARPVATGVLDARGVMIHRITEREAVGFALRPRRG